MRAVCPLAPEGALLHTVIQAARRGAAAEADVAPAESGRAGSGDSDDDEGSESVSTSAASRNWVSAAAAPICVLFLALPSNSADAPSSGSACAQGPGTQVSFIVKGLTYTCHLCFLCPRSDYFSTLLAWRIDASRSGGPLAAEAQRPVVLEEARSLPFPSHRRPAQPTLPALR